MTSPVTVGAERETILITTTSPDGTRIGSWRSGQGPPNERLGGLRVEAELHVHHVELARCSRTQSGDSIRGGHHWPGAGSGASGAGSDSLRTRSEPSGAPR
jgi:hypothetical protein